MKKNNSDNYEHLGLFLLDQEKHPIAFKAKIEEMLINGLNEEEALKYIKTTPIELEIYYTPNIGLWAVESDAVDNIDIHDPYTGELLEDESDED